MPLLKFKAFYKSGPVRFASSLHPLSEASNSVVGGKKCQGARLFSSEEQVELELDV